MWDLFIKIPQARLTQNLDTRVGTCLQVVHVCQGILIGQDSVLWDYVSSVCSSHKMSYTCETHKERASETRVFFVVKLEVR